VTSCLAILLGALLLTLSTDAASAAEQPPKLDAKAWVLIDARTGEVLAEEGPDERLGMASTTKMMTAYLALKKLPLSKKVPAADYAATPAESLMGLKARQKISVRDLLYGLIMLSGNDAAVTIAEAVSGSEKRFVRLMNRTAGQLGLEDTSYENSIGLDGRNHYSSAADLARLGQVLMEMPRFRPIASSRTATLKSYSPPIEIETLNDFVLNNKWAKGIKTGHTVSAGYVLVSDGRRRATELIGAVVAAPTELQRDSESVKLLDYGFSLYTKQVPVRPGRAVVRIPVRYEDEDLALTTGTSVRIGVQEGERLRVESDVPAEVEGPVSQGEKLGSATVTVDGERIQMVSLFASRDIAEPTLLDRLTGNIIYLVIALILVMFAILGLLAVVRHRHQSRMRRKLRRVTRSRR